jgi:hypothetical protein
MNWILEKASDQSSDAARRLFGVAKEILASVDICDDFAAQHVRERHAQMDSPNYDVNEFGPLRYSRRNLRAIEFCGAVKREDFKQQVLTEQRESVAQVPVVLELMRQQNEKLADAFVRMADLLERREVKQ